MTIPNIGCWSTLAHVGKRREETKWRRIIAGRLQGWWRGRPPISPRSADASTIRSQRAMLRSLPKFVTLGTTLALSKLLKNVKGENSQFNRWLLLQSQVETSQLKPSVIRFWFRFGKSVCFEPWTIVQHLTKNSPLQLPFIFRTLVIKMVSFSHPFRWRVRPVNVVMAQR